MKPGITAEIRLFSLYCICLKVKGFTVIGKCSKYFPFWFGFYRPNRPIYSVRCVLRIDVDLFVNKLLHTAAVSE